MTEFYDNNQKQFSESINVDEKAKTIIDAAMREHAMRAVFVSSVRKVFIGGFICASFVWITLSIYLHYAGYLKLSRTGEINFVADGTPSDGGHKGEGDRGDKRPVGVPKLN